jgi:phosphoribosylformimino-5-aminoimidazole carboxamide ribotide isomerase
MLEGPSFKLYSKIIDAYNINLVASGGVSEYDDILKLDDMGCYGIIIGKAIYENKISLKQLENFILKQK